MGINKSKSEIQKELNALKKEELKIDKSLAQALDTGTLSQVVALQSQLNVLSEKRNKILGITKKAVIDIRAGEEGLSNVLSDIGSKLKIMAGDNVKRIKQSQTINFEAKVYNTLSQDAAKNQEKISKWSGSISEYGKKIAASARAAAEVYDSAETAVTEIAQARSEQFANEQRLGNELLEQVDSTEAKKALSEAALKLKQNEGKLTQKEFTLAVRRLAYQKKSVDALEDYAAATERNIGLSEELSTSLLQPFEKMKGAIEGLPGGGIISKALGLDQFANTMGGAVTKSIQVALVDGPKAGIDNFKKLIAGQKLFNLTALLNPYVLIAAALIGIVVLLASITKEAKEHAKVTGLSVAQAKEQVVYAKELQSSLSNNLATTEDIVAVQKQMVEEFGRADMISGETTLKLADIGATLGYGADTAAQVANQLMTVGGATEELAANMQIVAYNMAETAGVAPGKVMKDLAKNGRLLAKSMAGNAKEMMKAAVHAASMGVEIDQMIKSTDSLLSIEESLTDQASYQAVSGKTINMERARELSAIGKKTEAHAEMVAQMKKQGPLDQMSEISRGKLAKLMNMEVGDMLKMEQLSEKTANLTAEQQASIAEYSDQLGDITDMSADQMLAKTAELQATEKAGVAMEQMKNALITAIMPAVEMMGEAFKYMGPMIKMLFAPLIMAFDVIKGVMNEVKKAFADAFGGLGEGVDLVSLMTTGVEIMAKVFKAIAAVIVTYIMAPFKRIMGIIGGIVKIFQGDILGGLKQIGGAILGFIMTPFEMVGNFIDSLFGTSIVDTVKTGISDAFDWVAEFITGVFSNPIEKVNKMFSGVGNSIKKTFSNVFQSIGASIQNVGASIKKFFVAPFDAVKSAVNWIKEGIQNMGASMSGIFTGVITVIKAPFNLIISAINSIIRGLNTISFKIPDIYGMPGRGTTIGFNIAEIPQFETGGVVTKTGQAVVHKGETITPAKKQPGSEGGFGSEILSHLKSAATAPLSMLGNVANSIGGALGINGGSDPELVKAITNLNAILSSGIRATVSATEAANAVNAANTFKK